MKLQKFECCACNTAGEKCFLQVEYSKINDIPVKCPYDNLKAEWLEVTND